MARPTLRHVPERIERRVIEILAVGMAVDHGAAEPELGYAAIEFVGSSLHLHRKMSESQ
jgi:hypothetical protein